jgi:hypothetical protein
VQHARSIAERARDIAPPEPARTNDEYTIPMQVMLVADELRRI